jgi:hypothetical protein
VQNIKAEADLEVAKLNAEKFSIQREARSSAQAEEQQIKLEAELIYKETVAKADLDKARKQTEGTFISRGARPGLYMRLD